ncbi:hypothetical protein BDR22DRAFT_819307 [Usnea florida]
MSAQDCEQLDMQQASPDPFCMRDGNQGTPSTDQIMKKIDPPVQTCQNRVSIEDRINDMTMQAAIELPIVYDSQGDTLIYIDPPQKQPEQDDYEYKRYIKRYENPIRMQKDTLTKYSPGLAKLFGPTQQYRVIRRRKLANKLPTHVKYVLDLTPPSEGDEGVRLWYQSSEIWKVARTLVKGEEEYTSVSSKAASKRLTDRQELGELKPTHADSEGRRSQAIPSSVMALEYSPVRHRSSIERVLAALQGNDPKLDSAVKVWTAFAVAKNFEITHSPLEDYIIRWLRAYPNSNFLEVLPEVSHQIADGLQNYDLARDSFAILVGEEALDNLRQARQPWVHKCCTFGRKKEELPEHIHTRVEYASKSFSERIKLDFADLVNNGMQWIDDLPEVQKLSAYQQREMQETIHELKVSLKEYVRGAIYKTLCVDYSSVPGPDIHQENFRRYTDFETFKGGHDLLPRLDRAAVWANMPLDERILSRTFWEALRSITTLQKPSNLDVGNEWSLKGDQLSHNEMQELDRGTYREVLYASLTVFMDVGQSQLGQACILEHTSISAQSESRAASSSIPLHELPDRTINGAKDQKQPLDLLFDSTLDDDIHNAESKSQFGPLPKHSYTLPDRTINNAQGIDGSNEVSFSTASPPIDVPKPLKRTQGFLDTLSPPEGEDSETRLRTKWPFGAARDDPVAHVRKSVDNLYISSLPTDRSSVADTSSDESEERGNEAIPAKVDPWRGFSDHLSRADNALQNLVPHKERFIPIRPAPKERRPHFLDLWDDNDSINPWNKDKSREQKQETVRLRDYTKFFDDKRFFHQAQNYIETFAGNKLRSSDRGCLREPLELGIVNTLVCLEESEWKYLPLWAGGNDDGSMGVYNDDLPTAEHGFTTAGPGIHDGSTPTSSIRTPSEFELVSDGSASTFNASTATNRGFSDAIRRGHMHAADSVDLSMSDSFTMVTASVDSDDEETFARKQVEAQERIEEANEAAANEARRVAEGGRRTVVQDESYADFFSGEDAEEEEEEEDDDDDDSDDTDHAETVDDDDMVMV